MLVRQDYLLEQFSHGLWVPVPNTTVAISVTKCERANFMKPIESGELVFLGAAKIKRVCEDAEARVYSAVYKAREQ